MLYSGHQLNYRAAQERFPIDRQRDVGIQGNGAKVTLTKLPGGAGAFLG